VKQVQIPKLTQKATEAQTNRITKSMINSKTKNSKFHEEAILKRLKCQQITNHNTLRLSSKFCRRKAKFRSPPASSQSLILSTNLHPNSSRLNGNSRNLPLISAKNQISWKLRNQKDTLLVLKPMPNTYLERWNLK